VVSRAAFLGVLAVSRFRVCCLLLTVALVVVGVAGCGASSTTVSRSVASTGAGQISPSMSCGSFPASARPVSSLSASGSSGVIPTHLPSSCTMVFSDGRRYRCSAQFAQHLAPGVTPASVFDDAKACQQLSRLVIPAALRAVAVRIGKARACLLAHGLRVVGGLVFPLQPEPVGESYAPAGELNLDSSTVLVGFYSDARQAEAAVPRVIENVRRVHGKVDRAGADNIVWPAAPPHRLLDTVQGCVPG